MNNLKPAHLFISMLIFTLISCTNNETGNAKNVNPDAIFFDYKIRGEEKDSNVTVYLQYRMGGPNGTPLLLNELAKVQLDGEIIPADSAKLAGAFYDIQKTANGFAGKHAILFTDLRNKEYKEEFVYKPFALKTKIPAVVNRGDVVFDFAGLETEDFIRVMLTDTSFHSRDIHEIDTVKNNRLIIPADELRNLVDGPITLQFYKEVERSVKNGTKQGGRMVVSYGLQREFELRE
jgi:hypothetical protein